MSDVRHPSRSERRALLTSLYQAAVKGAAPFDRTRDAVAQFIARESTGESTLTQPRRVRLFALGKAAPAMAAGAVAACSAVNWRIEGGVVVAASRIASDAARDAGGALPPSLDVRVGDHPVPDIGSLAAADAIARAVSAVDTDDLAIVLLSGGATSLCAAPCPELVATIGHPATAQALLGTLVQALLDHGLAIHEMNAIRRRLLRWGAGRLATAINARAASGIAVFAISDVIGDDPAVIGSGPCTADPNNAIDTIALIDAHNLRSVIDARLAIALGVQGVEPVAIAPPAPSHPAFARVHYEIVARNRDACLSVVSAARAQGIENVWYHDAPLEGEAESLGHAIALATLKASALSRNESVLVWGGEPTVVVQYEQALLDDEQGDELDELAPRPTAPIEAPLGGRMQALALAAATVFDSIEPVNDGDPSRISILAAGTDGRDGPTDAAGAIVDDETVGASTRNGRDPVRDLRFASSYRALDAADALLRTGHTGTNVMDLVIAYIEPATGSPSRADPGNSPPLPHP